MEAGWLLMAFLDDASCIICLRSGVRWENERATNILWHNFFFLNFPLNLSMHFSGGSWDSRIFEQGKSDYGLHPRFPLSFFKFLGWDRMDNNIYVSFNRCMELII
ncbi:unnamed protein product [Citrullus colocynthis]|uniref:Uncharacterized protein n=1 Tax=Citrullus colocynthis TaxID=252529 RepID=A0ABP0YMP1_9ROSI